MKTTNNGTYLSIRPDEGMLLTDGKTISDGIFAPINADTSMWREVTRSEAESLEAEIAAKMEEEASL